MKHLIEKLLLRKRTTLYAALILGATGFVFGLLLFLFPDSKLPILVAILVSLSFSLFSSFLLIRSLGNYLTALVTIEGKQVESLFALYEILQPTHPFPSMGGWSGSADFLRCIMDVILEHKPEVIVEASSGVSTVVAAMSCRRNGTGKVFSLEHHAEFAALTRREIDKQGLSEFSTVIDAPLKDHKIDGESIPWYGFDDSILPGPIDVLIIDGPPAALHRFSRFPALPLLRRAMSDHCLVILDDADRLQERMTISRWRSLYPELVVKQLTAKKGLAVITFSNVNA